MENEFVPFEIAIALKELGFNEPCFAYYTNIDGKTYLSFKINYEQVYSIGSYIETENSGLVPISVRNQDYYIPTAPLYQQAFKWFREKYKLFSSFHCPEYDIDTYEYRIYKINNSEITSKEFDTYEEAELECLIKLIELCKKKL